MPFFFSFSFNAASLDHQQYPDVTPDCEGEYETTMEVDRSTPPQARAVLDNFVKLSGTGLQPAISKQIKAFVDEFNAIE